MMSTKSKREVHHNQELADLSTKVSVRIGRSPTADERNAALFKTSVRIVDGMASQKHFEKGGSQYLTALANVFELLCKQQRLKGTRQSILPRL